MHLSLRLKQGNDETIKKHLALKLKEARELIDGLKKSEMSMNEALKSATSTNEQIMADNGQLKEENRRVVDELKLEEQKHINDLKEKMLAENGEALALQNSRFLE